MTTQVFLLLTLRLGGIVTVAALASLIRRRAAASERHWMWMIALGGALVLPLATAVLPTWRVVPLSAALGERSSAITSSMPSDARIAAIPTDLEPRSRSIPMAPAERANARRVNLPSIDLREVEFMRVALALWLAGTLVSLIRLTRAHARARAIVRASRPWIDVTCEGTTFAIRQSHLANAPFTYGVFRPTIIVPADVVDWPAARTDAVVRHEAAHVSRDDGIALLLAEVTCALYWWHPAVRFAGRQAAVECERACDDVVLQTGMLPSEYGTQLLAQAQRRCAWDARPFATIMFGRSDGIAARIGALLDPRVDRRPLRRSRALSAVVLGVATVALLSAAAPLDHSVTTPATPPVPPTATPVTSSAPTPRERAANREVLHTLAVPLPAVTIARTNVSAPETGLAERPASACVQADASRARTARFDSLAFTGAGSFTTTSLGDESKNSNVPRRYGTVLVWTGIDCVAWVRYADPIVVDRAFPGIKVLAGGEFAIHDESGPTRRDYGVDEHGTSWLRVDGKLVAMTPTDVTWLADMVREYVRRRGVGATARADSILVRGGAQALLTEVAQIGQGQVRVTYLLTGFAKVPEQNRAAFIHDGATLLDHASARGQFLLAAPSEWKSDERVLSAVYAEAALIEPDDIVERLLRQTPPPRPLSPALRPLIERLIATLQSVDRRQSLSAYYLDVRP